MAKLYPPYIEGVLPAFWIDEEGDGKITIPFAHNKAVSESDISSKMSVKVKTVQNDILVADLTANIDFQNNEVIIPINHFEVTSDTNKIWNIVVQRYWKLQLAYISLSGDIGYYSTVGVIKCTAKPNVYIEGFDDENKIYNNQTEFIGVYEQKSEKGDTTEKVYSSKFVITDIKGNEIATSGEVIHNVDNNTNSYMSKDNFIFNRDLEFGEIYTIVYTVTTNNGLVFSSPKYKITQQKSLNMDLKGDLQAVCNDDDGYVDISISRYVDSISDKEEMIIGAFVLTREDESNPGYWDELYRFSLNYESPVKTIFRDFTVEQGKTYVYSLQQYNDKIYSSRRKSKPVKVDFEDMFLFDGERQLKLRFNPQVSSFKTQLAESKTDTIGSKYPFFFRNAQVGYKTFPISGLVSMLTDDNQFFLKYDDIFREDFSADRHNVSVNKKLMPEIIQHTNLIQDNFLSERLFKLEVLDWVNNGKVKLFRSPGEGNYLVRLMENSLTPQTTVGRMIHTYNGTAYECAENNHVNLVKYNIVQNSDNSQEVSTGQVLITQWNEIHLDKSNTSDVNQLLQLEVEEDGKYHSANLISTDMGSAAYTKNIKIEDVLPGTQFRLVFSKPAIFNAENYIDITIGATGAYFANDIEPVYGIYYIGEYNNFDNNTNIDLPMSGTGIITYEYETVARSLNMFDSVEKITTDVGAYAQLVGENKVIETLTTIKEQAAQIQMSNYFKRPIEYLYYASGKIPEIISDEDIFNLGTNEFGYRNLNSKYSHNLYWEIPSGGLNILTEQTNIENESDWFDDKENMEYSPFSLYVLRNEKLNVNGVEENIFEHLPKSEPIEEKTHIVNHLFERYYIDRYLNAQSAEEMLTERTLLAQRAKTAESVEETTLIEESTPLYVLDPWYGKIYEVGKDFMYNPTIIYKNNKIDLREIQNYSLDRFDAEDGDIIIGNGVYGDIFYQKITINYAMEKEVVPVIEEQYSMAKDSFSYDNIYNDTKQILNRTDASNGYYKEYQDAKQRADEIKDTYITLLNQTIKNWVNKKV